MPGLKFLVIIEAPFKLGKIRGFIETMRKSRQPDAPDIAGPGSYEILATRGHFRSLLPGTPYTEPPGREVWATPRRLLTRGQRGEELDPTSFLGAQIGEFLENNPPAERIHHHRFREPQEVRTRLRNPDPEYNPARYLAVSAPPPAGGSSLLPRELLRRAPYTPWYLTINEEVWNALVDAGRRLDPDGVVYIATDDDPEGEAIGWHCITALRLAARGRISYRRARYREITLGAIARGLREADQGDSIRPGLLAQQQAREKLDRLIGYTASRALWYLDGGRNEASVRGLSLGRVQIAALLLLLEDEEIALQRMPSFSYSVQAHCTVKGGSFNAGYKSSLAFPGFSTPEDLVAKLMAQPGSITRVNQSTRTHTRPVPFSLSTLQQEMLRVYGTKASQVLEAAQALYAASFTTYPRTDSDRISADGLRFLYETGQELGLPVLDPFTRGQGVRSHGPAAHGAHEAIRPANSAGGRIWLEWFSKEGPKELGELVRALPAPGRGGIGGSVNPVLYARTLDMIWRRSLAVLLPEAETASVTVWVAHPAMPGIELASRATQWVNQGFYEVWTLGNPGVTRPMPPVVVNEPVKFNLTPSSIAVRVTAARRPRAQGLNQKLTRFGIGTPATIGSLLDLLEERGYVAGEGSSEGGMSRFGAFVAAFARQSYQGTLGIETTAAMDQGLKALEESSAPDRAQIELLNRFWTPEYMRQLAKSRGEAWQLGGGDPQWPGLNRVGNFLVDVRGRLRGIHGLSEGEDPQIEELIQAGVPLPGGGRIPPGLWMRYGSLRYIPSKHGADRGAVLMLWRSGTKDREYIVRMHYFYPDPDRLIDEQARTLMFSALSGEKKLADTIAAVATGMGGPLRTEGLRIYTPMDAWRYISDARMRVLQLMPSILIDSDGFFADLKAFRGPLSVWSLINQTIGGSESVQSEDEDAE